MFHLGSIYQMPYNILTVQRKSTVKSIFFLWWQIKKKWQWQCLHLGVESFPVKSEEGPISVMIIKSCLLSDSAMFLRKMQSRPQTESKQANKQNSSNPRTDPMVANAWSVCGFSGASDSLGLQTGNPDPRLLTTPDRNNFIFVIVPQSKHSTRHVTDATTICGARLMGIFALLTEKHRYKEPGT